MSKIDRLGRHPEPNTIRNEPVRRDEVLVGRYAQPRFDWARDWTIMTMPERTYRLEDNCYVGIEGLWEQLLEELKAEREAEIPRLKARRDERANKGRLHPSWKWETPAEPLAKMYDYRVREYACDECGTIYLSHEYARWKDWRFCSDRCKRAHHAAHNRAYFQDHPRDSSMVNRARTERRRGVREDRECETCGAYLNGERSSKKFCSDKCRVAAHRERRREAAGG